MLALQEDRRLIVRNVLEEYEEKKMKDHGDRKFGKVLSKRCREAEEQPLSNNDRPVHDSMEQTTLKRSALQMPIIILMTR